MDAKSSRAAPVRVCEAERTPLTKPNRTKFEKDQHQ